MQNPQVKMAANVREALPERSRLDDAIARAMDWLDREQTPDGYWGGMLESSYTVEAEWLLAMHFLGIEHPRMQDIAATQLKAQRADGSCENDYDAPPGGNNSPDQASAAVRSIGAPPHAVPPERA